MMMGMFTSRFSRLNISSFANLTSLAVEYALETTSVGDVPLNLKKYEIPTNANPYLLPWIMRGLLE